MKELLKKYGIDPLDITVMENENILIDIDNREPDVINIWMYEREPGTQILIDNLIIIPRENLNQFIEALEKCRTEIKSFAYLKGYDAGLNGTNAVNTHYSVFKDEQSRNDWEQGNLKGKEDKK